MENGDCMYILKMKQRLKFAGVHVLFSVLLLCIALYFIKMIWYPNPLGLAVGVGSIYLTLLAVDLILGPLLTFVVYKEDKRKLRFDLTVILVVQLSAYMYGLYTVAQGRPVWQVFVVDDIELVSPIDIKKTADYQMKAEFAPSIFTGPQWVAAVYSNDKKKQQEQKEAEMFEGINISARPEAYQPLSVQKEKIVEKLKPIHELYQFNLDKDRNEVDGIIASYPKVVGWLPMKAPELDMVVLFDKNSQPIATVNLRPWD